MNARLEAFCDAVFAFALTLLIIDVRIPNMEDIHTRAALWVALRGLAPAFSAFLLSFGVILITWVNHHNTLKLVHGCSTGFIYANGLLLLGVVCIPFTTSLLGAFILTDSAAPAVALYNGVLAAQALGWISIANAVLRNQLWSNERAAAVVRERTRRGYEALGLYSGLALLGLWLPKTAAVITTSTWILWLTLSLHASEDAVAEQRLKVASASK
jgi:uncharacterized membrane protein